MNLENFDVLTDNVRKKLNNLKPFSAPGPDGLRPSLLKDLSTDLCLPLAIMFQKSIDEQSVPKEWKNANIPPIFKKGSKLVAGNYRPVSLTSVICKVMESLIGDKIVEHLNKYELILPTHGFMNRRSCLTNLLEYLEKVRELVDEGNCVDVIYLDFAKAFN